MSWLLAGLSIVGVLLSMWTLIPPPVDEFWKTTVALSESSLFFFLVAVALVARAAFLERSRLRIVALVCGAATLLFSAYPRLAAGPRVQSSAGVPAEKLSALRYLRGLPDPPVREKTVVYNHVKGQALEIDVFAPMDARPAPPDAGAPVVMVIPWSVPKPDFSRFDRWLAQQNYIVFDISYRRLEAPDYTAAPADVLCALAWIGAHASEYGGNPARIAVLGRSTGARLALLAAYSGDAFTPSCDPGPRPEVRAAVALYAATDLAWGYDHTPNSWTYDGAPKLARAFVGPPQKKRADYDKASPVTYVKAGVTPTLLFHGGRDQVLDPGHMQRLADALAKAHVPYEAVYIPYAQHGFDGAFNGWASQIAQPHIAEFLRAHL